MFWLSMGRLEFSTNLAPVIKQSSSLPYGLRCMKTTCIIGFDSAWTGKKGASTGR